MEFVEDIKRGKSSPLKNITSNYHYHLIEADSEETLDLIEEALRQKKFLVEVAPCRRRTKPPRTWARSCAA